MAKDKDEPAQDAPEPKKPTTVTFDAPQTVEVQWRGRTHTLRVQAREYTVVDDDKAKPPIDPFRHTIQRTAVKALSLG